MAHLRIPAALSAGLAALALAGCGETADPEPLPTIDIPTFTTEAPEPTEAGPTVAPEIAAEANSTCLDALKSQYTAGLAVDGKPELSDRTARDLYPDQSDDEYAAAGIDPDTPLILVRLNGHAADGTDATIECFTWADGAAVADLTTHAP